jgi:PucR C-terminal helix-turn-helix domain
MMHNACMEQLVARLSALDAEAGAAVRVIGYFDKLTEGHVGLETLVRGAAVLSGSAAGLSDPDRRVSVRVDPDGGAMPAVAEIDATWRSIALAEGGAARAWLETGIHRPVDDLILERLAASVRAVLDRTRGRIVRNDGAALEVLFDACAPPDARQRSVQRLGRSPATTVRVLAMLPDDREATQLPEIGGAAVLLEAVPPAGPALRPAGRIGIGSAVKIVDAAVSWRQARTALRFTAAGTRSDPGPRVVDYAQLGALTLLADAVGPSTPEINDVVRLQRAAEAAPWVLQTLHEIATNRSLRAASQAAHVHHSTLQLRLAQVEQHLGWALSDPHGRLRLHVALTALRLRRTP